LSLLIASPFAVALDFDNTLTAIDVGDAVADRFGGPGWRALEVAHQRGEVPLAEVLRAMFEPMRVGEAELAAFSREIGALRPGVAEFLRAARRRGVPVVIASGGLETYIRAILGPLGEGIEIVANRARWEGARVRLEFPEERGCGRCGNCKRVVVQAMRARGHATVVAVGDGVSDRCMALAADLTLARGALIEYCRENALPAVPFEDFFDVGQVLGVF
jgi:2-hydroxy-3-keto-5-methylthiopentenyl-1-phosphate phosphatase